MKMPALDLSREARGRDVSCGTHCCGSKSPLPIEPPINKGINDRLHDRQEQAGAATAYVSADRVSARIGMGLLSAGGPVDASAPAPHRGSVGSGGTRMEA